MKSAREMVWQTSNMEYGRFYTLTSEADQRRLLGERGGRCEILTKTLIECRKQLDLMRLRDIDSHAEVNDGCDPPTESYFRNHLQKIKKDDKTSTSRPREVKYSGFQPESNSSAAKSNSQATNYSTVLPSSSEPSSVPPIPSNPSSSEQGPEEIRRPNSCVGRVDPTGIEEDTKQIECILSRLAEKLQPLTSGNLPVLKFTPINQSPVQNLKKRWVLRPKPTGIGPCKSPKYLSRNGRTAAGPRLPPYCRYGFYRVRGTRSKDKLGA
ncbi:hypothetical protein KP509_16G035100 [Ceratopteris richardii]|uniref:Uncharacterized protein n=1 Tax=Ceratopteris richardii TaxID=49495 RepID=A0A8T2SXY0_CERRI|nr:hypothetical protein KP509_16G035100 [Ceratopteris richardii]